MLEASAPPRDAKLKNGKVVRMPSGTAGGDGGIWYFGACHRSISLTHMTFPHPRRAAFSAFLPGFALALAVLCAPAARAQTSPFVQVEDGHFVLDGQPYYYAGANFWYGMNLGADAAGGDPARLTRELDALAGLGLTNLRVMAATEGPDTAPFRVRPSAQPAPGIYNEAVLRGLDRLLAEMGRRGMKAVLVLNNFFQWSGGMAQYVSWATGTPIPYPNPAQGGPSWDDFQNYSAQFYANAEAQRLFRDYVSQLVQRTNHVTGTRYRDDPTIMAWQLSNEPRGFAFSEQYVAWVEEAAGFIQRLDPNHLVSLGGEGKLIPANGTQFRRVARLPALDYLTAHIWIENWGWFDPQAPDSTFAPAVGQAMGYLADHVSLAREVGKPLVLEEFGAPRDGGAFEASAGTRYRDAYYTIVLEALYKLAAEGNAVGGSNVWSWAGSGQAAHPGQPWQPGEPFTGDPPHEQQGWYSIYDADASTQSILARYARRMAALGQPAP